MNNLDEHTAPSRTERKCSVFPFTEKLTLAGSDEYWQPAVEPGLASSKGDIKESVILPLVSSAICSKYSSAIMKGDSIALSQEKNKYPSVHSIQEIV